MADRTIGLGLVGVVVSLGLLIFVGYFSFLLLGGVGVMLFLFVCL